MRLVVLNALRANGPVLPQMRTYYEGDRGRGGGQRGGRSGGYSRNFNPKFQNKDSGGGGYRNNRRFQPRGEEQEATLGLSLIHI